MRRCALNRFFIAAPAQAFVTAFFIFVGVLAFAVSAAEVHAEAALAFGYDSGGRCWYGTAWNYRTKDEARSAAMQRCLQKGAPCEVVLQTSNGCIALATGTSSNASGLAARSSKEDAQREALQTCVRYNGGRACAIREVFCDTVSEEALAQEHEGNEPEVQPRPNDADKRGREAADAEQQKQTEALKRELEESERAPARSAEQDTRAAARRALEAAFDGCRLYVKDSCETALRSLVISDNERADALVWRGIAKKFANDQAKCTNGTPDACEAAIASPAADANDRERLEKLKGAIPLRVPLVEQARPQAVPPVESPTPAATPTTGEWLTWLKELAASIADVVTYARSAVPIYVLIASGLVLALAWLFLARLLRLARWLQGRVAARFNRPQAAGSNVGSLLPEAASAPEPHDLVAAPFSGPHDHFSTVQAAASRKASPWALRDEGVGMKAHEARVTRVVEKPSEGADALATKDEPIFTAATPCGCAPLREGSKRESLRCFPSDEPRSLLCDISCALARLSESLRTERCLRCWPLSVSPESRS